MTDNEKTVTVEHVAGIPVRNPQMVAFARHYGLTVHTCVPADPATKGGSESTVQIAKADLVPTEANLLADYASFAELEAACAAFCRQVNARVHRVTRRAPAEMLAEERARLHPLPDHPYTAAFGVTRTVPANTPMVSFENGSYSVPHRLVGQTVWVRPHGEQVVIVHVGEPARSRSPGTRAPPRAARGSTTRTSRRRRRGRWTAPHGRNRRRAVPGARRRRGAVADRGRRGRHRRESGPRWPRRSPWPSCSTGRGWTGRSGTPRPPAGSPRATSPRSWPTRPAPRHGAGQPAGRRAPSLAQGTGGWAGLGERRDDMHRSTTICDRDDHDHRRG